MQTPYAHHKNGPHLLTGTSSCAYPTPNGWVWASKTWALGWEFSIETTTTDPRYGSPTEGDLRLDHCFFCGESTDPRKSEHYESPRTHVLGSSVHSECLEEYTKLVWTNSLDALVSQ